MRGMDRTTGKELSGTDHLKQSISDILTTPIGSRVYRRNYGSRIFELIDEPLNGQTKASFYAATAEALDQWEPRFKLDRVVLNEIGEGYFDFSVYGFDIEAGESVALENLTVKI